MTREEAVQVLRDWDGYFIGHSSDDVNEAIEMAIKALKQEPCGDCISRQAVLDKMKERDEELSCICPKDIRELPNIIPQEPKTDWIPVSERLPNPKEDVLAYDGTDMFVAWYSDNEMWQGWSSYNSQFDRYTPIIAWMPLPEPYKADKEGKE